MPTYTLPDLQYDYGALEPHISGKIMELHHDKHHAGYVKGANDVLDKLDEARSKEDFTRVGALEKALAFNLSGHVLHSLFWQNLVPKGGGQPQGPLMERIQNDFGSFDKFKRQLTAIAGSIMGSGGLVVMAEHTNMVDVARFYMQFCMEESCGKCIPCRAGTVQMYELLTKIVERRGTMKDLEQLEELCDLVKHTSLCGLGQTAPNPVLSTLRYFRNEYLELLSSR